MISILAFVAVASVTWGLLEWARDVVWQRMGWTF
jgi:hypothetical protein